MLPLESSPRPHLRPRLPRSAAATVPALSSSSDAKAIFSSAALPETRLPARSGSRGEAAAGVPLTDPAVFRRAALNG
jgi:hypothetical protein